MSTSGITMPQQATSSSLDSSVRASNSAQAIAMLPSSVMLQCKRPLVLFPKVEVLSQFPAVNMRRLFGTFHHPLQLLRHHGSITMEVNSRYQLSGTPLDKTFTSRRTPLLSSSIILVRKSWSSRPLPRALYNRGNHQDPSMCFTYIED